MKYETFEDIPVWKMAKDFSSRIYSIVQKSFGNDYVMIRQLTRASLSIPLNIAEGFERASNKEFAHFINIAKGSAGEVRTILYIAYDNNYLTNEEFINLKNQITEISKQLSAFRSYLIRTN